MFGGQKSGGQLSCNTKIFELSNSLDKSWQPLLEPSHKLAQKLRYKSLGNSLGNSLLKVNRNCFFKLRNTIAKELGFQSEFLA